MKANFFEQIAGLSINGSLQIIIHQNESGTQTVSVLVIGANPKSTAGKNLPPMLLKGSPQELDEAFFQQLAEPVKQTVRMFTNADAYQKELEKSKKQATGKKDETKTTPTENQSDDDEEDDNNLFTPQPDDKDAKAEKKRLYDEAMDRVKSLNEQMKYAEAIAQLPDAEDYPDKADEINVRRKALVKRQELYASLQTEV